ncbi:hypothetical protein D6821_00805, partial [Candidatus Parcubacteria bacterium]
MTKTKIKWGMIIFLLLAILSWAGYQMIWAGQKFNLKMPFFQKSKTPQEILDLAFNNTTVNAKSLKFNHNFKITILGYENGNSIFGENSNAAGVLARLFFQNFPTVLGVTNRPEEKSKTLAQNFNLLSRRFKAELLFDVQGNVSGDMQDSAIDVMWGVGDVFLKGKAQAKIKGDIVYLKIISVPPFLDSFLDSFQLKDKWAKVDPNEADVLIQSLSDDLDSVDQERTKLLVNQMRNNQKVRQQINQAIEKHSLFKIKEELGQDEAYHYR